MPKNYQNDFPTYCWSHKEQMLEKFWFVIVENINSIIVEMERQIVRKKEKVTIATETGSLVIILFLEDK